MRDQHRIDHPSEVFFQPLSDQGVMVSFPQEAPAFRFAQDVRQAQLPWVLDVVQAYFTVAVFTKSAAISYQDAKAALSSLESRPHPEAETPGHSHEIPCCYEMALDLRRVTENTGLSTEEIVRLHTSTEYTVYAIGFCPGFPYLGYLPPALAGVPRLESPRLRVEAGSVGLTGRQTGIYTLPRPGGWSLIGRTPLQLVDLSDGYFPLQTGDRVRFIPIDEKTFTQLKGERL